MKRFKDYSPDQQLLLPPDLNDWLEEGHLADFIRDVVGELDLCQIYDDYHSQRGGQLDECTGNSHSWMTPHSL